MANTGECLPSDLGAEKCSAWDCEASTNKFCTRQWCFVDPKNCRYTHFRSTNFEDLHYSYGTCGYVAFSKDDDPNWLIDELQKSLDGKQMRIAFPGDVRPYVVTEPAGCEGPNCNKTGAYVDFVLEVLHIARVNWTRVEISNASRAAFPLSSFSACVHEVSIGGAELCIGNFWTTSARLEIASFTSIIHIDVFRLVTIYQQSEKSMWDHMETPYSVFSGQLWAAICAMVTITGVALWS
eukprot:CAMPEP_0198225196 /NCGR_PEP_ID=MMETSP1445-20131203/100114_1 /TAXON_ID=36898 /ORGANISM="Pyramimonas sp., Strain CCMP2087" /LENGTH=237 /DNA_ID=CAMNT_0043904629 /DNA_START=64 /DNA_END=774 /DNA_ORIENTATION=-